MNCLSCFIFISVQFRTHFAGSKAGGGAGLLESDRTRRKGPLPACLHIFHFLLCCVVVLLFRVQRDDNGACRPTDVSNKVSRIKDNRGN